MKALAGWAGRATLRAVEGVGAFTVLLKRVALSALVDPFRGRGPIRLAAARTEMVRVGWRALPVTGIIALFMGIVLALQGAYQLERFGITILVVDLVAVALTREIAPLVTAVVVAGRSGSAIAAEIGSMKVAEEIDALRSMGLSPVRFLAVPRYLALGLMLPCLTLLSDAFGMFGGSLIGAGILGIPFDRWAERTAEALVMKDVLTGLCKSFVFALIIAHVGCHYGFRVRGGASEVGTATTASVVASIFLIVVADVLFTALFYAV